MQKVVGVAAVLTVTCCFGWATVQKPESRPSVECCRPSTHQVTYTGTLSHTTGFGIASTIVNGRQFTLYVTGPSQPEPNYATWESSDSGTTWVEVDKTKGISRIDSKHNSYWRSPSDPQVIYSSILDVRSHDAGSTWQQLVPRIDGLPSEDFAFSFTKRKGYRVEFNLAAIAPRDPQTVYAGMTLKGDVNDRTFWPATYVSHDSGDTWTKFTDDVWGSQPIGTSPVDPNVMYGVHFERGTGRRVIVKSADGGRHWSPVSEYRALNESVRFKGETRSKQRRRERIRPIYIDVAQWVFDPSDVNIVYLVSNKGVYRTINGGQNWCLLDFGIDAWDGVSEMVLNPLNPREIFIGAFAGIFRSEDRGCHFENISPANSRRVDKPPQ
jgi:hypothetical protein